MPKRYPDKDEPEFVKGLLPDPEDDYNKEAPQRGGPPAIRPPRKHTTAHEEGQKGRGLLAFLDPWARRKDWHDFKRFDLELGTGTELLRHRTETARAKSKVNQQAEVSDHSDKARNWLEVQKLKNRGHAIQAKYSDFQDTLNQIAEQQLDPMLRQKAIEEIYHNYQTRCDDGCDECEEDEEP